MGKLDPKVKKPPLVPGNPKADTWVPLDIAGSVTTGMRRTAFDPPLGTMPSTMPNPNKTPDPWPRDPRPIGPNVQGAPKQLDHGYRGQTTDTLQQLATLHSQQHGPTSIPTLAEPNAVQQEVNMEIEYERNT